MKFPIKKYKKVYDFKNDYYDDFKSSFENIKFENLNDIIENFR